MSKHTGLVVFTSFAFLFVTISSELPPNPCPQYFQYVRDADAKVLGSIQIPYMNTDRVDITVKTTMKGFFGKDKSILRIFLLTRAEDLVFGRTNALDYQLIFPVQESIPALNSIIVNGNEICSGPGIELETDPMSPEFGTPVMKMETTHYIKGLHGRPIPVQPNPLPYPYILPSNPEPMPYQEYQNYQNSQPLKSESYGEQASH